MHTVNYRGFDNNVFSKASFDDVHLKYGQFALQHFQEAEGIVKIAKHMFEQLGANYTGAIPLVIMSEINQKAREFNWSNLEVKAEQRRWLKENPMFTGRY